MKKLIKLLLAVLIICCVPNQVNAESEYERVNDLAGLMSESETASLNELADIVSEKYQCDIVILTVQGTDGKSLKDYADDFYDEYGYGYGDKHDGVILLISMEERDWRMSTTGYGITAFTDWGIQYIGNDIKGDLSNGKYYDAFKHYIELTDNFLTEAKAGKPYDTNHKYKQAKTSADYLKDVAIGLVIGLIIAFIVTMYMKSKLKSVAREYAAKNYVSPGSLNVTASRELYLYSTRTMTEKPKNEDGGSSTHTGSSGTTHGGGGGSF